MRIDASWLQEPNLQRVCSIFQEAGFQILLVGGCVRNTLLGAPISDIDLSTDATPDQVLQLAEAVNIRAVPTGFDHGTVTLISEDHSFEVTTFRKDISTDGRRADVQFSRNVMEDAARRDFTMNAIYCTADGEIVDPLSGMSDLRARKVRFIGVAEDRIREDFLRILRFFRFSAWYGDDGFDPDALAAIASNREGLTKVSKERIGQEMRKLLLASDPAPAISTMEKTGVLSAILPGSHSETFPVLVHFEAELGASPGLERRIVALGAEDAKASLRLTNAEAKRLDRIRGYVGRGLSADVLGYRLGYDEALDVVLLEVALLGNVVNADVMQKIRFGVAQVFPIKAADLLSEFSGAALGAELSRLEEKWIVSGFSLGRDALLS